MSSANPSEPASNLTPVANDPGTQPVKADHGDEEKTALRREIDKLREERRSLKAAQEERAKLDNDAAEKRMQEQNQFKELADLKAKEVEARDKQIAELKARQDAVYIDAVVRSLRSELLDPDDIKLFSTEGITVENGEVKGIDDKWADFKKRKKHLLKTATPASGSPSTVHPGGGAVSDAGGDVKKMNNEQFDAFVRGHFKGAN